tara:strand:+ start:858 stop:1487 length:630 start_codon:yes stop_codon:yes gene_type:complete
MFIKFTKKEFVWVIVAIIILGFIIEFSEAHTITFKGFIYAAVIIFTSILIKNLAADYFYLNIEHKVWEIKQYWFTARGHFKKPIPFGLILPFFIAFVSIGTMKIMTILQFNGKPSKKKILKKRGSQRKEEANESDFAFISAWGFWGLIILAIISSLIKQPELAKYALYYGTWNLLPISQLDGSKLFFGSLANWILLVIAYAISLIIVLV